MRILHIFDHSIPLHSGYTFRSRAILEQQAALGWETFHLTGPKHNQHTRVEAEQEQVDGLRFYRSPDMTGLLSRLPVLNQWEVVRVLQKRLDEVVRELKPDVLHAHSPALNGVAALRVARKHDIPLVYEIRAFWEDAAVDHGSSKEWGLRYRLTRAMESHVVRSAQAVTVICEGLKGDILGRGIAEQKVTVIPNAVDIANFQMDRVPDEGLRKELGLEGKQVVGFIGSFYAYEGLSLLLDAMPDIAERLAGVCLLLVGGGPEETALRQQVNALGLEDKVVFTGRVPHEKVQAYYDLVDVFAYPRLKMRLTDLVTPLKPLEAMAQGKMVVASDVGGHQELIRPGETGELFAAGSASSLADAVVRLMSVRNDWPRRAAAGRRFVEEERNWAASVSRYQAVYQRLLEGRTNE